MRRWGPSGFLESRMWTVVGVVATSMHSPPVLSL
ncbi:predicted protein [Streptomyces iranensis]|uniref:Uncharacterized protein n=1 Tax=Streptomyces iranensis TaxID=576784 RepID=A0A060ZRE2_9ACTN|nr:predicted protein [Streptomyces iranensis]